MKIVRELPRRVREARGVMIRMRDGARLAARVWAPEDAEARPVPAILEYIPYRQNDLTRERDAVAHPYVAGHGYAVVRVDLRGSGDSDGLLLDEYLPQEQEDGCDVIAWIAAQPWCDGSVGMIGISWGGFNGLQIAALRPPALKAVISVCSTDDRYADDMHAMDGCLLLDRLSWASIMFGFNSLPPDPRNRPDWRELWTARLEANRPWLLGWLTHQRRDAFFKHGSVCENYAAIEVPVYAVGGWADGYRRAVFRLMENLPGSRKGLIGPWAHVYPHQGAPGPAIGFLRETLRWWDFWLKGRETGIMEEPMLRLFLEDPAPPQASERTGRWVAEPSWPSPNVFRRRLPLGPGGRLSGPPAAEADTVDIRSPLTVGAASGKWCAYAVPADLPGDQHADDAASVLFETAPLAEPLEIVGEPVVALRVAADQPVAQVAARLVDAPEDGPATRIAYGVLNLTHRESHARPTPLRPGEAVEARLRMTPCARRVETGSRLRLALSSSLFPLVWPAPEAAALTLFLAESALDLPLRAPSPDDAAPAPFAAPEGAPPPEIERLQTANASRRVFVDPATGEAVMEVVDCAGVWRLVEDELTIRSEGVERYAINCENPSSAEGRSAWTLGFARGSWRVLTASETVLTADASAFRIRARLRAWDDEVEIFNREWDESVPRDLL